jgi:hypothetical protein
MAISIPSQVAFMYRAVQVLPALKRGSATTHILQPGEVLEVTAPATGQVKVFSSTSAGAAETETTLNTGAAQSFGPVSTQLAVRIVNQPFSADDATLSIARLN